MSQSTNPTQAVNATLFWPNLDRPNQKSKKYQVDVCNLSDGAVKWLTDNGMKVRNKGEGDQRGNFITCKSLYPIVPVSEDNVEIKASVGNGTQATVGLKIKKGNNEYGPYTLASIQRLIVTDLVEYERTDEDDDESTDSIDYADAL